MIPQNFRIDGKHIPWKNPLEKSHEKISLKNPLKKFNEKIPWEKYHESPEKIP